jgi:hypothetical protein
MMEKGARHSGLVVALAAAIAVATLVPTGGQSPKRPVTVVVGDLHMSVGRDAAGRWPPHEDFRWPDEFAGFLDAVTAEASGRGVDLVLNGDTFELSGPAPGECAGTDRTGCSELEALQRFDRVARAHRDTLAALSRFASVAGHRVHVVPGHDDAALLLPGARAAFVRAFASAPRVALASSGAWRSNDGRVVVEHGHQHPHSPGRFDRWPQPWLDEAGGRIVERTVEERILAPLLHALEARFPILDNIVEQGVGAKFALSIETGASPPSSASDLARVLLSKPVWSQFRSDLEEDIGTPPTWDLTRVRAQGARLLVESFAADDPVRPWIDRALGAATGDVLASMSDEALVSVCDYRAAVRRSRRRMERALSQMTPTGPALTECPRTADTVGPAFQYFWRSRDRDTRDRLGELAGPDGPLPDVYVAGHTHVADRGFTVDVNGRAVQVINPGAWHRTIVPARVEAIRAERGWSRRDALERLTVEDLSACYAAVWIAPADGAPRATLRWWRSAGGSWSFGERCESNGPAPF